MSLISAPKNPGYSTRELEARIIRYGKPAKHLMFDAGSIHSPVQRPLKIVIATSDAEKFNEAVTMYETAERLVYVFDDVTYEMLARLEIEHRDQPQEPPKRYRREEAHYGGEQSLKILNMADYLDPDTLEVREGAGAAVEAAFEKFTLEQKVRARAAAASYRVATAGKRTQK